MSSKIYKSAMGKPVDLGALLLQNEQTRAVGNMNVNARGDILDSANRVIDPKNQQVQRQYRRQSNNSSPVARPNKKAKSAPASAPATPAESMVDPTDTFEDLLQDDTEPLPTPASAPSVPETRGGLAAAIARSREIKQELEKTPRQRMQEQSLKKI
jgi:hypothetical protein